jgi:hypothetical protein
MGWQRVVIMRHLADAVSVQQGEPSAIVCGGNGLRAVKRVEGVERRCKVKPSEIDERWISVKDAYPDDARDVWTLGAFGVNKACFEWGADDDPCWWSNAVVTAAFKTSVTHWMEVKAVNKSAEAGMDRQQEQAEAERLLCALVTAVDSNRDEVRGHLHRSPGLMADGSECAKCRAWRQAREYVRAIQAGKVRDHIAKQLVANVTGPGMDYREAMESKAAEMNGGKS